MKQLTVANLQIKSANTSHKSETFKWWNDPFTRKMMKRSEKVSWQEHSEWYESFLAQKKSKMYIASSNNQNLGVVRFNYQKPSVYEISINLAPKVRGQGLGKKILKKSIQTFSKDFSFKKLIAMCKKENESSKRVFIANQFKLYSQPLQCEKTRRFNPNKELFLMLDNE